MALAAVHWALQGTLLGSTMLMRRLDMCCTGWQVVGGQQAAAAVAQHSSGLAGAATGLQGLW